MSFIKICNWFNTTDVSVYKATKNDDGTWHRLEDSPLLLKGKQTGTIEVSGTINGIYLTYWPTVGNEKTFGEGYMLVDDLSENPILDIFDIRAGNMPFGYYASWRVFHLEHP